MWNKSTPSAVTSNYGYYDSWNTDTASSTYTQGLHTSGPALDNTHGHIPQFYNSHNNNYGNISYENPENVHLNNLRTLMQDLRALQERVFQTYQEKIHMFCETLEQNISKKIDNMQNYYDKK